MGCAAAVSALLAGTVCVLAYYGNKHRRMRRTGGVRIAATDAKEASYVETLLRQAEAAATEAKCMSFSGR